MTLLPGLGEKLALSLTLDLVKASAALVRRRLAKNDIEKALQAAVATALDQALASIELPLDLRDHYEDLFEKFFHREAVVAELAQLLDPRPGVELDFQALAKEFEAEFDPASLGPLDMDQFLRTFASAFYAAAVSQEALRGNLEMKLLAEMVSRTGLVVHANERIATATEQMTVLLQRFLEDRSTETAFLQAGREARDQGLMGAFQALEGIAAGMFKAGFDFGVGRTGTIEIGGADLKALPPAQAEIIRTLAGDLRQTVLSATPDPAELDALEERYRQHIVRWFESLQFQGLMRTPRPIVLPLEEVYVELRAVAEVPEAADAFSVEERRLLLEHDARDESGRRELMSQLDALRRERWSRTIPERKSIAEALHQRDCRAFVILGDPGSGKSTLLHFLALVYARGPVTAASRFGIDPSEAVRLPIFVPLAAFDDMLRESGREGRSLTLLDFLPRYYDRRRGLPGLEPLFRRALASGRALVLLDGLDEVLDVGTRTYIAQQAGALIGEWSPRGVRFAVSSRFVGYRESPVPGNLPILSVLDFGPPEIEIFVRRWAHAYEKWAANGEETLETLHCARTLESDLLIDVRSNEGVRRLAANPLMLTMLALLRRQVGKLPHRRVQLFESYSGALLETWIAARNPGAREKAVEILDRHRAENLLLPLALWLQKEKPSGTAGSAEIRQKVAEICLEENGFTWGAADKPRRREAEEQADRFLYEMRQMTGLVVERGHDSFGFLHLTFQEYFAGRALASLSDHERWESVRPHLHDPRWREPILLCAGRLGTVENRRSQVTQFVRSILDCPDSTEESLHRNLLLALAIAGDDVNLDPALVKEMVRRAVACLPTWIETLAKSLIGALGQLVANGAVVAEECFGKILASEHWWWRKVAIEALAPFAMIDGIREMLLERLEDSALQVVAAAFDALTPQVELVEGVRRVAMKKLDSKEKQVRASAVRALAGLVGSDRAVYEAILERLSDSSSEVQMQAAYALSKKVELDAEMRQVLLAKLKDSRSKGQWAIPIALSATVNSDDNVCRAVLANLDDFDWGLRRESVRALSAVVGSNERVRQAVLAKLHDEDPSVRRASVRALSGVVGSDEEALRSILAALDDQDMEVSAEAVKALSKVLSVDKEVRNAHLAKLENGREQEKVAVLRSLASLMTADSQVYSALRAQSDAVVWRVRMSLAEALGDNASTSESLADLGRLRENRGALESLAILKAVVSAVSDRLAGNERWRSFWLSKTVSKEATIREVAVAILKERLGTDGEVLRASLEMLEDESYNVRLAALSALSGLVGTNEEVRRTILKRLEDKYYNVRCSALSALSRAVGTDEKARRVLLERLEDKWHAIRESALSALSVLVETDKEVRRAILKSLEDKSSGVQRSALSALSRVIETDEETRCAVLERLGDKGYEVRESALSALSGLVGTNEAVRRAILKNLEDESDRVQRSALSALSKVVGTDEEVRRAVLERLGDKRYEVRQSALSALSGLIGTDEEVRRAVLERLGDNRYEVRQSALQVLSGIVGTDGEVRRVILARLKDKNYEVRWSVLQALPGTAVKADEDVRRAVLERLNDKSDGVRLSALGALSQVVEPDGEMRQAILERLKDKDSAVRQHAITTLASWGVSPDDRRALVDRLADQNFRVRLAAVEAIVTGPPESIDPAVLEWIRPWVSVDVQEHYLAEVRRIQVRVARALSARIPDDPSLRDWLFLMLRDPRWSARLGAALTCLFWPAGPPQDVLDRIFDALDDRRGLEAYPAQLAAASFLINRNGYAQESIDLCLEALDYGTQSWEYLPNSGEVRQQAALVLSQLEPLFYDEKIYDKLLHVMENDGAAYVRDAAYGALVRLARVRKQVATAAT